MHHHHSQTMVRYALRRVLAALLVCVAVDAFTLIWVIETSQARGLVIASMVSSLAFALLWAGRSAWRYCLSVALLALPIQAVLNVQAHTHRAWNTLQQMARAPQVQTAICQNPPDPGVLARLLDPYRPARRLSVVRNEGKVDLVSAGPDGIQDSHWNDALPSRVALCEALTRQTIVLRHLDRIVGVCAPERLRGDLHVRVACDTTP